MKRTGRFFSISEAPCRKGHINCRFRKSKDSDHKNTWLDAPKNRGLVCQVVAENEARSGLCFRGH
jgi:hypothetical protein